MQNMTVQRGGAALGCLLQAASHSLVNTRRGGGSYGHVQGRLVSVYFLRL